MKKQGRGTKALAILKYTLALLATIAPLKVTFFLANDEDYAQATSDFFQLTTELSPQRINNTQRLSATIVPDEPTAVHANAPGEITDAFVNSGDSTVEGQNLLQVERTSVSETVSTSGGTDSDDEDATAVVLETTVTWGSITARAFGIVQWDIIIGQAVGISQEISAISPNNFHAVTPIKPSQLCMLGDSINNGRLAVTDGPAPFLCDSVKAVTGSGADSQGTGADIGDGAGMGAATAGNSSGSPQLRCDIPADQTVYENVPATLILGSGTTSEVPALPVTTMEGRFRESVIYVPARDDGKPTKIKVELGANDGIFIEIKRGLKKGQQVLEYVLSCKNGFAGDGSGDDTSTSAGDGSDTGFNESGDDAGSEKQARAILSLTAVTRTVTLPNGEGLPILKGIDLEVPRGEYLSIVGQSGPGKSMPLNIISVLDLPDSGTYTFNGADISTLSNRKRAALRDDNLGSIFQQFNLFPSRTTLGNVEVPLMYDRGEKFWNRTELAAAMLECVDLDGRLGTTPSQLSGGEQQRMAIARVLVRQPQLILADEPIGALGVDTGKIITDPLKRVATENNAALIVVTHDLEVAEHGDRALELRNGQLHIDSVLSSATDIMHDFEEVADDDK